MVTKKKHQSRSYLNHLVNIHEKELCDKLVICKDLGQIFVPQTRLNLPLFSQELDVRKLRFIQFAYYFFTTLYNNWAHAL